MREKKVFIKKKRDHLANGLFLKKKSIN